MNVSAALRPPSAAAAAAMSAHVRVTAGVPATWNAPRSVSSTTSAASASSNPAAICRADSTRASAVTWTAVPPCWSDRDPIVRRPCGHEVGVAPDHVDLVHRDARVGRRDHRPRGDVTLPVRGRARVHGGPAVLPQLDAGVLVHLGSAAGDLDVHAHADAELLGVAARPPDRLLGAQVGVAGGLERLVEGGLVVADVVRLPDGGGVGLPELGDQVLPSHVDRVHADLGREEVHGPLDGGAGLGPARTAVGDDRRGVRDHGRRVALDLRDGVDARGHGPRHEGREHRADLHEARRSPGRRATGRRGPSRPGCRPE